MEFNGTLNHNRTFNNLFNAIIGIRFGRNLFKTNSELLEANRVEGSMYGDTLLFHDMSTPFPYDFQGDEEAANLLTVNRLQHREQPIVLDIFKQIMVTTGGYVDSKQAWMKEGGWSEFESLTIDAVSKARDMFETREFNTHYCTETATKGKQIVKVSLPKLVSNASNVEIEAYNRNCAQIIANKLAELEMELKDYDTQYTDNGVDYGFYSNYKMGDLKVAWNADWANKITKVDLPTLYHKDGLFGEFTLKLPSKYFCANTATKTILTSGGTSNGSVRSRTTKTYFSDATKKTKVADVYAGDLIPNGGIYEAGEAYVEDPNVICKIAPSGAMPCMGSYAIGTEFYNPRSHTANHYLTTSFTSLEHLHKVPFITVVAEFAA